ncbi:MAG TPA: SEC-C metal-binding domain-containing protein [Kofleriaceae bacterium]|nr:SEC-C metal-binding domain-containing protein [Kofleriaceae bacterium]
MSQHQVSADDVEKTIVSFTRLDQRGDKKAMNKLAQRLQKEQPFLLQHAAAVRSEHGDAVGEAAVFYATLVWAMFDRIGDGTLPRLTAQNLAEADRVVTEELSKVEGLADKPPHERVAPALVATQPHIYAKLSELLMEDVKEAAMTADTASTIIKPTEVVVEAFDAAISGRRPGERQGTIVATNKVGRNEPCPCGSGKKYKKCHGEAQ